ncbi:MAG: class I SAM-dependent methyltransferase [Acidobacteriota bacterium]|nr:class I SAM-dependent methyltransferase [Acidobacteriota bacterium]
MKSLVRKLLSCFDFAIPGFMARLKRISGRRKLFAGYVNICGSCGHGEMSNPPGEDDLREYYQDEYWSQRSSTIELSAGSESAYLKNPRAIHQVDFVMERVACDSIVRVLEIGAGAAYASLLLRSKCRGLPILHVCETGDQWEDYYRRQGIEKVASYFPFETDERFDYVHASHWLEHVLDLGGVLSVLSGMVRPSGYLFVEVPNTEHFYWDLPGRDTPHIHFFTRESLVKALEGFGFSCLKIGEYGITRLEKHSGVPVTRDRFGACKKGFWIRGLFKRAG